MHDLGNVKGIRDLTATWEAGFTKIWARIRDWERKQCSDSDDRSSRKKEAGMCAGSGTPFPDTFCIKSYHRPKDRKVLLKKAAYYF